MRTETDLADFAPDLEIADRIVDRARAGVPDGRHIMANDVLPLIRAYVVLREKLFEVSEFMADQHQRELAGMDVDHTQAPKG